MSKKVTASKESEIERIVQTLVNAIAQRRLKPGQRIVESKIVEILNANRNHVQVALKQMALANIVHIERNKGAFVSQPSAKEARDVFAARRVVELGILEQITPEKINTYQKELTTHIEEESLTIEKGDPHKIVLILTSFHRLLAKVSENSVLMDILDNLLIRSSMIEMLYSRNAVPSCASCEHKNILSALQEGDNKKAVELMVKHIEEIEEHLILVDEKETSFDLADALNAI
ncbi:GntR family transcriptional regulator [Psychromonas sp. 14N.309.X.WAT.B.A12]|uniref:GntR family transcriptional regulator n=1 Tax=Psychromonas sp. 14N.309.X.WAT.B.A12 TaxID=2998322 RepID=UPI0025AFAB8A|nr:GntR family transcriptional regulator [Psychromonas sp. 14N.309.X.WAT.B.A12]MDN2663267.1 GntR family transcriptional regulator [Psychromonas sp. 14N.309.X.WAT.B.A12]